MSTPVQKPMVMIGGIVSSGDVQTGEMRHIRGGGRAFCNFSGTAAGNDLLIYSGAGRLNTILQHVQMLSGQSVVFYDSAINTSGGPFAASGHKIVGILPSTFQGGVPASGATLEPVLWNGFPFTVDMPFQSGLCAATRSGTPGFTVSFSPEVDSNFPSA